MTKAVRQNEKLARTYAGGVDLKKFFIGLIRFYRKYISPLKAPSCKFYPTCSQYAIDAIEKKGLFLGLILAIWRILRCNPFSRGGYDPVK